jgi:hypothetical protein
VANRKIGLAVYYSSLADLNQEYEVGAGMWCVDEGFPYSPNGGESCSNPGNLGSLYAPQDVMAELTTELFGGGFGWKLSDVFSIGLSAAYVRTRFSGSSLSDPTGYQPSLSIIEQSSEIDDEDVMYSLGLLYRGDVLGFGLSYRSETQFDIFNQFDNLTGSAGEREFDGVFLIPERIAGGFALFPSDNWVVAFEYVRLPYSAMPKEMPDQFNTERKAADVEYSMTDVSEYHLGFEYTTFRDNKGWSLRFGYWRDQSHLIYSSQGYNDPLENDDDRTQAGAALLYQKLDLDFDHFTAGVGAAFGFIRVDAAVDYSEDVGTDFLLSAVLYF